MVNKGGLIRVIEASIAILIVFGVLIVVFGQRAVPETRDLGRLIPPVLQEMGEDTAIRNNIMEYDTSKPASEGNNPNILEYVSTIVSSKIGFAENAVAICDIDQVCALENVPITATGEIYAEERVITATLDNYAPKKVKVYLWRE